MMSLSSDEDPLMLMSKWMPNMSTMIMTYGSYHKDQKKFPMAGITAKHKFEKGSIGYAKRYTKMSGDFNTVLDYSEFFADLELKNNFSLIAKFKRDDNSNTKIESIFGVDVCTVAPEAFEKLEALGVIAVDDEQVRTYVNSPMEDFTYRTFLYSPKHMARAREVWGSDFDPETDYTEHLLELTESVG